MTAHDRREQHDSCFRRQGEDFIHDVARGLRDDGHAGFRAMRPANVRVERSQVVVDFGRGRDDGARVAPGTALLDGNRRRQAFDVIHFRPLHLIEKLPGIGGKRFDIPSLALGVNRVKGEGRLPRTAQTGDDDQLITRDFEREIFEIVLTRAADADEFFAHGLRIPRSNQPTKLPKPDREAKQDVVEGEKRWSAAVQRFTQRAQRKTN